MTDDSWLVVGLGNPGPNYAANRHNVGEMVVAELGAKYNAKFKNHKANAMVAEVKLKATRLVLAGTNTYMNNSGGPVANLLKYFKITPANLIVIHDELDLPFDSIRLKFAGGHGGHNGLRDIISAIGTAEFTRVRIGIGRPPGRQDPADFVLSNFSATEKKNLPVILTEASDAVEEIVEKGLVAAQQRFHSAQPSE
ncbi:MAG: aminoacyl-tRNA hydrolase [Microbacteriaceae bacterium]|nr:aminoacyl-tRNA hydrolase [Microbacteriaceae bacterium]